MDLVLLIQKKFLVLLRGLPRSLARVEAKILLERIKTNWSQSLSETELRNVLKLQARLSMKDGPGDQSTVQALEEAVRIDPLDGEAIMMLGQYFNRAKQPDQAILWYERAASIESFAASAKVKIAQILVGQARFDDALQLLRDAQSQKPRDDVARYIEQVERASKSKR